MSLQDHLKDLFLSHEEDDKSLKNEIAALERWSSSVSSTLSTNPAVGNSRHNLSEETYKSPALERLRGLNLLESHDTSSLQDAVLDILQHPLFIQNKAKLMTLLNSSRSDGEISGDIAEIVGFDELDLATSLMQHRQLLAGQASLSVPDKAHKSKKGKGPATHHVNDFSEEAVKRRMAESLRAASERPLWTGTAHAEEEALPHVYTSGAVGGFSSFGTKYMLPIGTTRRYSEDYEEVTVPPAKTVPPRASERLIPCSELPPLAKGSFLGYKSLNRIQSIVYHTAFKTNENMLICAPTGAGKTDVAMLSVLRTIDQHRREGVNDVAASIRHNDFKIIYVAPMKALAAEIVRKLGKRLAWLRIQVRELTGDMQLTKQEIAETQIIVTTPEKWDVVTRKPTGEGELATKVKLLIIDEVHLLNDERGAVIETIVARTVRQVESTQSLIRIVGLSATLPNYVDVADFLRVPRRTGLFYFDSSFRPVPLEQHFLGVKGKLGTPAAKRVLDKTAYHLVSELVREGHQVMVFVHSRKDTVKSAESLKEFATLEGELDMFGCQEDPQFEFFRRDVGKSKNREMKQLYDSGFGIHHAGMLRADRNLMERLFDAKVIKVLCCTATLAWGVNLPAHGVVIKGTQLYDASHGKFVDLSVLDVLQIFGRAGRPGMETSGVGYICTSEDKLQHYLEAITAQHAIESKFMHGLLDSLNAEIALGTVTNVSEGAEWLGYTYLFVRMRKNPMVYGLMHEDPANDPDLTERRHTMIKTAGLKLAEVGMVRFDKGNETFAITDIGRIAAKYYVRHASIEVFQKEFKPTMTEADALALLSMSTEFDQLQVRENEIPELEALEEDVPCDVKGGAKESKKDGAPTQARVQVSGGGKAEVLREAHITSAAKVNILLQAHISRKYVEDFALVSDSMYSAQNGGRIIRALLEIALSRKWAKASAVLMSMSKSVEKRMWEFEHPLAQFNLSVDLLYNLQRWADETEVDELASMSAAELGALIHLNEHHGTALLKAAKQFPRLSLSAKLRPLSHDLLSIQVTAQRGFDWSDKIHVTAEPFWIWAEDDSRLNILQLTRVSFGPSTDFLPIRFIIPLTDPPPQSVIIRAISDRWVGADQEISVSFDDLVVPSPPIQRTPLLDLPLLRTGLYILDQRTRQTFSRFTQFNSIQTQCFWSIYNTERNILVSASSSSGKSILGQVAICRALRNLKQSQWIMVVMPRLDNARTLVHQLRQNLGTHVGLAQRLQDFQSAKNQIWVITAQCLLELVGKNADGTSLQGLRLVICEDLDLLDSTYEIALSHLLLSVQTKPVRIVGLAAALNDTAALSDWLGVPFEGVYCFPPTERDQALSITFQTFNITYSAALMKAMTKPVYDSLRTLPIGESAILFVPSVSQCSMVVAGLVTQCAVSMNMKGFLGEDVATVTLEVYAGNLKNRDLADGVMRGMAIWHDWMDSGDKMLMLRLFVEGVLRVLVIPRELCWNVPVRAGLVIVMGTQYAVGSIQDDKSKKTKRPIVERPVVERPIVEYSMHESTRMQGRMVRHGKTKSKKTERQIVEYSMHELIRMQGRAVRHGKTGHFHVLCQAEHRDAYMRFLTDGIPLESQLLGEDVDEVGGNQQLREWVQDQRSSGGMKSPQDVLNFLASTFLARRIVHNPTYYDAPGDRATYLSRIVDSLWNQPTEPTQGEAK